MINLQAKARSWLSAVTLRWEMEKGEGSAGLCLDTSIKWIKIRGSLMGRIWLGSVLMLAH